MRQKPLVIWKPWPGSQQKFLTCPVWECLLSGNRGGGKTDVLIMDFLQNVGKGFGADYKGLILREATTELGDVISKTRKWIPRIFPMAKYNGSKKIWTFPEGESLWLNYARVEADYEQYHGHEFSNSSTAMIHCPNNVQKMAGSVVVGDLLETLQGPKKVTRVFHYKKPGVIVSVLDEDLNLIGQQQQGLIHPVLCSNGEWRRIGLSCLFQISEQSSTGKSYLKEVTQFLSGVHQEILHVSQLFSVLSLPATSKQLGVQYSCLCQIFYQFSRMIIHSPEVPEFPSYGVQEILWVFQNKQRVSEIFGEEFVHEHPAFLQLLHYCVFLIDLVSCAHQEHSHLEQSILYCIMKASSSPMMEKFQETLQLQYNQLQNLKQVFSTSGSILDYDGLNDTCLNALPENCKESNYLDGNLNGSHLYDEQLLQVLSSDLTEFPLLSDAVIDHPVQYISQDFSYSNPYSFENHSKISVPCGTKMDSLSFSVSSLETPIDMVDFEVEDAHHYISTLNTDNNIDSTQSQDKKQISLISSNCYIGWEELTNHALPNVYLKLMSCNRSSNPKIPLKYRATCNPSGPGHMWVKQRFIDVGPPGKIIRENLEFEYPDEKGEMVKTELTVSRTRVQSYQQENKSLVEADPLYMAKIFSLTQDNEMLRKAWIDGSWDLLIGGFFTDVWDPKIHVLPNFNPPKSWKLFRSFDWGSSKPWAVTYGAECNGEQPDTIDVELPYFPKGSVVTLNEIYGWTGTPDEGDQAISSEIAERVLAVDNALLGEYGMKVIPGPADSAIWAVIDGTSIGAALTTSGCNWTRAHKGPGSRVAGWSIIRQMLGAAKRKDLERPHLYFFQQAEHHIRTLPLMQRDKKKPEDLVTESEDHIMDSLRYLLSRKMTSMKRRKVGI